MDVRHYNKAEDFLARAQEYMDEDEARYNLVLGIAHAVKVHSDHYGAEAPWFCTVSEGKDVRAAALRTPPYMVVMDYFSGNIDSVAAALVKAVAEKYREIPGVVGEKALAEAFAEKWCKAHSVKVTGVMAQRGFKLVKVNDVPVAEGRLRRATEADREIVKKWSHGFYIDCFGENSKVPESDLSQGIRIGRVFLWEAGGQPVSMAETTRPTGNGMSAGGVYTPPELRGKGYATSCVASVSRHILQSGCRFCTLYTDLSNPTSNSIYKKIGYVEMADSVQLTFGEWIEDK